MLRNSTGFGVMTDNDGFLKKNHDALELLGLGYSAYKLNQIQKELERNREFAEQQEQERKEELAFQEDMEAIDVAEGKRKSESNAKVMAMIRDWSIEIELFLESAESKLQTISSADYFEWFTTGHFLDICSRNASRLPSREDIVSIKRSRRIYDSIVTDRPCLNTSISNPAYEEVLSLLDKLRQYDQAMIKSDIGHSYYLVHTKVSKLQERTQEMKELFPNSSSLNMIACYGSAILESTDISDPWVRASLTPALPSKSVQFQKEQLEENLVQLEEARLAIANSVGKWKTWGLITCDDQGRAQGLSASTAAYLIFCFGDDMELHLSIPELFESIYHEDMAELLRYSNRHYLEQCEQNSKNLSQAEPAEQGLKRWIETKPTEKELKSSVETELAEKHIAQWVDFLALLGWPTSGKNSYAADGFLSLISGNRTHRYAGWMFLIWIAIGVISLTWFPDPTISDMRRGVITLLGGVAIVIAIESYSFVNLVSRNFRLARDKWVIPFYWHLFGVISVLLFFPIFVVSTFIAIIEGVIAIAPMLAN